jgi:hypothetical protein
MAFEKQIASHPQPEFSQVESGIDAHSWRNQQWGDTKLGTAAREEAEKEKEMTILGSHQTQPDGHNLERGNCHMCSDGGF